MRATGRTTRMLADAKAKALEGRAVYVIAANEAERRRMKEILGNGGESLGIKVETPNSPGNFHWPSMRLVGAHPNCITLVDHFAIEQHFASVLEMLHRYDDTRHNTEAKPTREAVSAAPNCYAADTRKRNGIRNHQPK